MYYGWGLKASGRDGFRRDHLPQCVTLFFVKRTVHLISQPIECHHTERIPCRRQGIRRGVALTRTESDEFIDHDIVTADFKSAPLLIPFSRCWYTPIASLVPQCRPRAGVVSEPHRRWIIVEAIVPFLRDPLFPLQDLQHPDSVGVLRIELDGFLIVLDRGFFLPRLHIGFPQAVVHI